MNQASEKNIEDVIIFDSSPYKDERGYFKESWRKSRFISQGLPNNFFDNDLQNNVSLSHKNTVRGFHAQPWTKLMTVAYGEVDLVLLDLRENSKTFKCFMPIFLNESQAVYVPEGVATSIYVKSDIAVLNYIVTGYYDDKINYLTINPSCYYDLENKDLIVSKKDKNGNDLKELIGYNNFYELN